MAEQPGGKDFRVVDDHEIAGAQEIGQRADDGMGDRSAVAIELQEARGGSFGRRLLRDQF